MIGTTGEDNIHPDDLERLMTSIGEQIEGDAEAAAGRVPPAARRRIVGVARGDRADDAARARAATASIVTARDVGERRRAEARATRGRGSLPRRVRVVADRHRLRGPRREAHLGQPGAGRDRRRSRRLELDGTQFQELSTRRRARARDREDRAASRRRDRLVREREALRAPRRSYRLGSAARVAGPRRGGRTGPAAGAGRGHHRPQGTGARPRSRRRTRQPHRALEPEGLPPDRGRPLGRSQIAMPRLPCSSPTSTASST